MLKGLETPKAIVPVISQSENEIYEGSETRALFLFEEQTLQGMTEREKRRLFPADELGIPLSIYVPDSYRHKDRGRIDSGKYPTNRHHRFAPKKVLIHQQGELGKILRYSSVQIVPQVLHDEFNKHYDKPLLPATRAARFGAILLSVARYLPAEAVDFKDGNPVRRELTLVERQRIWANNELRPQSGTGLHSALLDYVVKQDIKGADELIEDFLTTPDEEKRMKLGKDLFQIAAEVAVEPIEQRYVEAWEGALLPRQDIRADQNRQLSDLALPRAVPKRPRAFIARHVASDHFVFKAALNKLYSNLEARYIII